MTYKESERILSAWHNDFHANIAEVYTPTECVYNIDQTGLYYQKLPNRVYVDESNKKDCTGVNKIKDKKRIKLMVGTSDSGKKCHLL